MQVEAEVSLGPSFQKLQGLKLPSVTNTLFRILRSAPVHLQLLAAAGTWLTFYAAAPVLQSCSEPCTGSPDVCACYALLCFLAHVVSGSPLLERCVCAC